jgi:hypothetical protein
MLLSRVRHLGDYIHVASAGWFLILAVLSLLLKIFVFWKKKDLKVVALQFCLSGIAGYFEDVVFIWLQSYHYYPRLLKNPYYDNTLGAYFSQVYYVSSVAVLIASFNLGFIWILFFTVMFVGIEYFFLALGIYKLYWWHPSYTAVGLFIYFWVAKRWYKSLLQVSSCWIRLSTLNFMNYILYGNIIVIPVLAGHYHFFFGWFADPARDTIAVIIAYCIIRGFITAAVCFYRLHWPILAFVLLFMGASYFILIHLHLFTYKHLWDLILFPVSDAVIMLCCYYFNGVLSKIQK